MLGDPAPVPSIPYLRPTAARRARSQLGAAPSLPQLPRSRDRPSSPAAPPPVPALSAPSSSSSSSMMAAGGGPVRLRLMFDHPPPASPGCALCWLLLEPGQARLVTDLLSLIRHRFGFSRRARLSLFLQGALLPPAESARLVRDNDSLRYGPDRDRDTGQGQGQRDRDRDNGKGTGTRTAGSGQEQRDRDRDSGIGPGTGSAGSRRRDRDRDQRSGTGAGTGTEGSHRKSGIRTGIRTAGLGPRDQDRDRAGGVGGQSHTAPHQCLSGSKGGTKRPGRVLPAGPHPWDTRQELMPRRFHLAVRKIFFPGTDCPERMWSFPHGGYCRALWTQPCALGLLCLGREVRAADPAVVLSSLTRPRIV